MCISFPQRREILKPKSLPFRGYILSGGAPPARWVWGVTGLGEWAAWQYVHRPSTRPGGGGSSPCCRRCWSRPRSVAAPPPPRCETAQVRTTPINTRAWTGNRSIAPSSQRDKRMWGQTSNAGSQFSPEILPPLYLCPLRAAWWRGVYPVLSTQFTFGPLQILWRKERIITQSTAHSKQSEPCPL